MKIRELHRETWVPHNRDDIFAFFSDPKNMLRVTPDYYSVTLLDVPPIEVKEGTIIGLRMKLYGIFPITWQTKIEEFNPPDYFVDTQPKGLYRFWKHTHRFIKKDGGTLIIDHVEYAVPGFLFEPLIHKIFVERSLKSLFDFRQNRYVELFE